MKELKIGRLSKKPELKEVTIKDLDGKVRNTVTTEAHLYIYDRTAPLVDPDKSKTRRYDVPVKIIEWGEQAKLLSQCEKGEQIVAMGSTKAIVHNGEDGKKEVTYGILVSSFYRGDEGRAINKQLTSLLNAFERKQIDKIWDMEEVTDAIEKETGKSLQPEQEITAEYEMESEMSDYPDFDESMDEVYEAYVVR